VQINHTASWTEPKTKQAALNLGAYIINQRTIWSRKRENLMASISNAQVKLKKLEAALAEYQNQLSKVQTLEEDWGSQLDLILKKFQLTEAEILETKSQILREQLESLQSAAGVQEKGPAKTF